MERPSMKTWPLLACLATVAATKTASAQDKAACLDAADQGQKLRGAHQLIAARDKFRVCAAAGCPGVVQSDCAEWLDGVEKDVPTIVFEVRDGTGQELTAVRVTLDGKPLVDSLDGTALPVDPGAHTFGFEVAGQPPVTQQFVLHEGQRGRTERVLIGGAAPAAAAVVGPTSATGATPGAPPVHSETPAGGSSPAKRAIAYVTGGVGVALLGLATYYQATALSRDHDSENAAASTDPNVRATSHTVYGQASQAQTDAMIFGGIGVAAVGAGLFLFLTSGSSGPQQPAESVAVAPFVSRGAGGLQVGGNW
jgi:hypothetical protein